MTNDDGIGSSGLHALVGAITDMGWTPVVAAPTSDWSGASAALGPLQNPDRVAVDAVDLPGSADVEAHAVEAPPALIVMLAMLGGFGEPPELVVAGVNQGLNTGRSTLYSATVGAVLTAQKFGRPGRALSQVDGRRGDIAQRWSSATEVARPLLAWLVEAARPTVLNVNVPNLRLAEMAGIRQAELAPIGGVRTTIVGRDEGGIHLDLVETDDELPERSDTVLVRSGHVTVSAITGPTVVGGVDLPLDEWWGH